MELIKRKSGDRYRIKFNDISNKPRYKTFKTKTEAKKWKEDMESLKRRDPLSLSAMNQKITFLDLFNRWFEAKIKNKREEKTILQYQGHNRKHFARFHHRPLQMISSFEVEKFVNDLVEQGLRPKSVNNVLILLKQIFKYSHEQGLILKNPLRDVAMLVEPETDVKFFFKEEVRTILNINRFEDIYPVLVFVFNCGLRVGEVAGLCWDCINFETRQILVKRNMTRKKRLKEYTKTKSIRYVPMNEQVYDVLRYLLKKQSSQRFVFAKSNGEPIDPDHYSSRQFKEALIRADIAAINFHKTRHTFASHFMMNGGNIYDLQKILGHRDIQSTMKYAHLSPDHLLKVSKIVNFKSDIEPQLVGCEEKSYQTATEPLRLIK